MKRIISNILVATIILTQIFGLFTVSADSVIEIKTKDDLFDLENKLSSVDDMSKVTVYLLNDIIFTEDDFKEGGKYYNYGMGWDPIGDSNEFDMPVKEGAFVGTFDGKGHKIKGLYCRQSSSSADSFAGLFGGNSGTIKNLILEDVKIIAETAQPCDFKAYAGGIAASNYTGKIENCKITGNSLIKASGNNLTYCGGIAAKTSRYSTGIFNCANEATIIAEGKSDVYVGGISGSTSTNAVTIQNCYNKGNILSSSFETLILGGIIGNGSSKIINCYNTFNTKSITDVGVGNIMSGGIVGNYFGKTIQNCYFLDVCQIGAGNLNGTTSVTQDDFKLLTKQEFSQKSKLLGFDFESVWYYDERDIDKYPRLLAIHDHDLIWNTIKKPTETVPGKEVAVCKICNQQIDERVIPMLKNPLKLFTDVKNDWTYKGISFAINNNLFNGMTPTTFEPNSYMTRGMFVTVLARADGQTLQNKVETIYPDVLYGKYYTGAVKWASDNKIVNGSDGKFMPLSNVSREQICKMIVEYCKYAGITLDTSKKPKVNFDDAAQISNYAKKYVEICQRAGVVSGKGDNKFDPKGNATRAEVATIFLNLDNNYHIIKK